MLAFPEMLVPAAVETGIKVPNFDKSREWDSEKYVYFTVFANVQIGAPMPRPTSHWNNARVIAAVPDDKIKTISLEGLIAMGLEIGYPVP